MYGNLYKTHLFYLRKAYYIDKIKIRQYNKKCKGQVFQTVAPGYDYRVTDPLAGAVTLLL